MARRKNNPLNRIVYLDKTDLPKLHNGHTDWEKIKNIDVRFEYGRVEGIIKIIDYDKKTKRLNIVYKNNNYEISPFALENCYIKKIIDYHESEYEIGDVIINPDKGTNLIITNKKYMAKDNCKRKNVHYQYKCNNCGFDCGEHYIYEKKIDDYWVADPSFKKLKQCICCQCENTKVVVPHINSIVVTAPWMIDYFQGGYEEAMKNTKSSSVKKNFKCPDCGAVKKNKTTINDLHTTNRLSCDYCGHGVPYPERFFRSLLEYLNVDYIYQLSSSKKDWCQNFRYDFYFKINNEEYIVETHGVQHYNMPSNFYGQKQSDINNNDMQKYNLAIQNGIKPQNYITVDCSKSDFDYIKNSILNNTNLLKVLNIENINWEAVAERVCTNLFKKVCEMYNDNPDLQAVADELNLCKATIRNYVKIGTKLGLCYYNPKESFCPNLNAYSPNGEYLGTFTSPIDAERQLNQKYNLNLNYKSISSVCCGTSKTHKGYTFSYII